MLNSTAVKVATFAALALAGGVLTPTPRAQAATACPATNELPTNVEMVKAVRVYTAADGESAFEDVTFKGSSKAYFKPGELFSHVNFGPASKVQLVAGPANAVLSPHASPSKEMFMILRGESTVVLPRGAKFVMTPGMMVIFDDMTSKTGHGGTTGPCGYLSLNIVPPPASDQVP